MGELKSLFRGIAVLIDDEVLKPDSSIDRLAKQIESDHSHVIRLQDIPTDAQLDTLTEAAFFILDWNLHDIQADAGLDDTFPVVRAGDKLKQAHIQANLDFLDKIRERRFAPVFIFTNEVPGTVIEVLKKANLYNDGPSDHIFVQGKDDVLKVGVFEILAQWIQGHPSAYVLKCWETAYAKTRNDFFIDFYSLSHLWPVVLWQTYSADHISETAELTAMIGRNIVSRLAPVRFDPKIVAAPNHVAAVEHEVKPEEIRKVLEGERFVREKRLQADVSVGDVFYDVKDKLFFMNIRPECDCVDRKGEGDDSIKLYLIHGEKVSPGKFHKNYNSEYGSYIDRDSTGTIFAMYDGVTVCFQFQDLQIGTWGDWKSKRIGRLIPPYSTKLQQRYASYIQRIGLARIPDQAVPPNPTTAAVGENPVQHGELQSHSDLTAKGHFKAFLSKSMEGLLKRS